MITLSLSVWFVTTDTELTQVKWSVTDSDFDLHVRNVTPEFVTVLQSHH